MIPVLPFRLPPDTARGHRTPPFAPFAGPARPATAASPFVTADVLLASVPPDARGGRLRRAVGLARERRPVRP